MLERILLTIILIFCLGCPALEPPPPTTTTIPTTSTIKPPPTGCALPDVGRGERKCYVTTERAGTRDGGDWQKATGLIREMMLGDQELVNTARNFLGASKTCGIHLGTNVSPYFTTTQELRQLAEHGFLLHDGGREIGERNTIGHPSMLSFIGEGGGSGRLEKQHRNCNVDAAKDPWCGRTGVFRPALDDFRTTVSAHMIASRNIDGRGNDQGYDGIRAWCKVQ